MTGAEAGRFIGPPASLALLQRNLSLVNDALLTDLSLPGILLGLAGLILAIRAHRRTAITLLLLAGRPLALPHPALQRHPLRPHPARYPQPRLRPGLRSRRPVASHPPAQTRPPHPRPGHRRCRPHPAPAQLRLHPPPDHRSHRPADSRRPRGRPARRDRDASPGARATSPPPPRSCISAVCRASPSPATSRTSAPPSSPAPCSRPTTPSIISRPPGGPQTLGRPVWLDAAAPRLVHIRPTPDILPAPASGPQARSPRLHCEPDRLVLELVWHAGQSPPPTDLSVFVKAFSADGALLAQGDQFAPVYGLRPTSAWRPGERLRDFYPLDLAPAQVSALSYGLYHVDPGRRLRKSARVPPRGQLPAALIPRHFPRPVPAAGPCRAKICRPACLRDFAQSLCFC